MIPLYSLFIITYRFRFCYLNIAKIIGIIKVERTTQVKKEKITLIKPKKHHKKETKDFKIIEPILLFILGIILLTNSSKIVIIVFYVIGSIFALIGIYNLISYHKLKKDLGIEDTTKLVFGTSTLFIGFMILILSSAIETFLRFIIGILLLYNGLKNTLIAINIKNYYTLPIGILLIGMGLYTILAENIILQIIGVLLITASVIDFLGMIPTKK